MLILQNRSGAGSPALPRARMLGGVDRHGPRVGPGRRPGTRFRMPLWVTITASGGLLLLVLAYAVWHMLPGRYTAPDPAALEGIEDGVYVVLNPG